MEKVIRNGEVAVIISSGYGSGWYSWYPNEILLFHPKLVDMIESGNKELINKEWILENLGIDRIHGGFEGLEIKWIPIGTAFRIKVFDGHEELIIIGDGFLVA